MNVECALCNGDGYLVGIGERQVACLNCHGIGTITLDGPVASAWREQISKHFENPDAIKMDLGSDCYIWGERVGLVLDRIVSIQKSVDKCNSSYLGDFLPPA